MLPDLAEPSIYPWADLRTTLFLQQGQLCPLREDRYGVSKITNVLIVSPLPSPAFAIHRYPIGTRALARNLVKPMENLDFEKLPGEKRQNGRDWRRVQSCKTKQKRQTKNLNFMYPRTRLDTYLILTLNGTDSTRPKRRWGWTPCRARPRGRG